MKKTNDHIQCHVTRPDEQSLTAAITQIERHDQADRDRTRLECKQRKDGRTLPTCCRGQSAAGPSRPVPLGRRGEQQCAYRCDQPRSLPGELAFWLRRKNAARQSCRAQTRGQQRSNPAGLRKSGRCDRDLRVNAIAVKIAEQPHEHDHSHHDHQSVERPPAMARRTGNCDRNGDARANIGGVLQDRAVGFPQPAQRAQQRNGISRLPEMTGTRRQRKSSKSIPSATSISTSPRSAPQKARCTYMPALTAPASSPSSSSWARRTG